jgi:hypothetical protein
MPSKTFTAEEAQAIIWNDSPDFTVLENEIVEHSRFSVHHKAIILDKNTGKHYRTYYSVAATEHQEEMPYDYVKTVEMQEVEPVSRVVTLWEDVK